MLSPTHRHRTSIDAASKKVEMTFRSGDLTRATPSSLTLSDLREGQKVDGRVKRIEQYGVFIEIEGSKISGLCHKSQASYQFTVLPSSVNLPPALG